MRAGGPTNTIVTTVKTSIILPCLAVCSEDVRAEIASDKFASFCRRSNR